MTTYSYVWGLMKTRLVWISFICLWTLWTISYHRYESSHIWISLWASHRDVVFIDLFICVRTHSKRGVFTRVHHPNTLTFTAHWIRVHAIQFETHLFQVAQDLDITCVTFIHQRFNIHKVDLTHWRSQRSLDLKLNLSESSANRIRFNSNYIWFKSHWTETSQSSV